MNTSRSGTFSEAGQTTTAGLLACAQWFLWQCLRVPLFLFLAILVPVVSFVLGSSAVNRRRALTMLRRPILTSLLRSKSLVTQ